MKTAAVGNHINSYPLYVIHYTFSLPLAALFCQQRLVKEVDPNAIRSTIFCRYAQLLAQ